jgi:hypothetical protein
MTDLKLPDKMPTFDICAGTTIAEETLLERPAEEERAPPLEEHRDNILI